MTDTTKVLWRVQVRKSRDSKWQNKGLFETREAARNKQRELKSMGCCEAGCRPVLLYGFGNTRVVRHERGAK